MKNHSIRAFADPSLALVGCGGSGQVTGFSVGTGGTSDTAYGGSPAANGTAEAGGTGVVIAAFAAATAGTGPCRESDLRVYSLSTLRAPTTEGMPLECRRLGEVMESRGRALGATRPIREFPNRRWPRCHFQLRHPPRQER